MKVSRLGKVRACSLLYLLYFIFGEFSITIVLENLMLARCEVVEELLAISLTITKVEVLNFCHNTID